MKVFKSRGWEAQSKSIANAFIHYLWAVEVPLLSDKTCVQIVQLHIKHVHLVQQPQQAKSFFFAPSKLAALSTSQNLFHFFYF